jgi:hypothetical protein
MLENLDTKEQQKQRDGKKCTNSTLKRFSIKTGRGGERGEEIVDYVDNPQPTLEGDTTGSSPHGAI